MNTQNAVAGSNIATVGRRFASLAVGVSMCAFLPGLASAAAVSIDDLSEPVTISVTGTDPGALNIQTSAEGADAHFEYTDATPLANGQSVTVNFNIFGLEAPNLIALSDTLNVVITGHSPIAGVDNNNTSVDLHFRSDSESGGISSLVDALVLAETGAFQDVSGIIGQFSGLSNLSVQFASDVAETPLPAALPLFASGLGMMGVLGWRRKRKVATAIAAA